MASKPNSGHLPLSSPILHIGFLHLNSVSYHHSTSPQGSRHGAAHARPRVAGVRVGWLQLRSPPRCKGGWPSYFRGGGRLEMLTD